MDARVRQPQGLSLRGRVGPIPPHPSSSLLIGGNALICSRTLLLCPHACREEPQDPATQELQGQDGRGGAGPRPCLQHDGGWPPPVSSTRWRLAPARVFNTMAAGPRPCLQHDGGWPSPVTSKMGVREQRLWVITWFDSAVSPEK